MKPICVAVVVACAGCSHEPDFGKHVAYPDGPDFSKPTTDPDAPSTSGYDFCRKVSRTARLRSVKDQGFGWGFAILGVGATATGTIIPLSKDGPLTFSNKVVSASLTAGGLALIAASRAWFNRSDAASRLAGATAAVLGERDGAGKDASATIISEQVAGSKCNVALGAWESSRSDSSAIATALLDKQKTDSAKDDDKTKNAKIELMKLLTEKLCPTGCSTPEQTKSLQDALKAAL